MLFIYLFFKDISHNNLQSYGAQVVGTMLQQNDTLLSLKVTGKNRTGARSNDKT